MFDPQLNTQGDDDLLLSGIQHFSFCRRQWALIHIEGLWAENLRTTEGHLIHERAHDASLRERRGNVVILRGMSVHSVSLGIRGQCDVVEFHVSETGIPLPGIENRWQPYPVEYKRGSPKETEEDRLQLCAQAICLEEMLCCEVPCGALYYGEMRHREQVIFTEALREQVRICISEMHDLMRRGYTPKVKPTKKCNACSLKDVCVPKLMKKHSVSEYLSEAMREEP